jgi:hypothetical protein
MRPVGGGFGRRHGLGGGEWWTHNAFGTRDSRIGALWLPICEVFDPGGTEASLLLRPHRELLTHRNVGFNQPHCCRHDYARLCRGDVKAFLETSYNEFASLQDRGNLLARQAAG